jgi:hypothetical protein
MPFFVTAAVCAAMAGWRAFGARRAGGSARAGTPMAVAAAVILVWGLAGGLYAPYALTAARQAHRALTPDSLRSMEVWPGKHPPTTPSLVVAPVTATAAPTLRSVGQALRDAQPWTRATGPVLWSARLRLDDGGPLHRYVITATTNRQVFIELFSEGDHGWVLGVWRADTLLDLLPPVTARLAADLASNGAR